MCQTDYSIHFKLRIFFLFWSHIRNHNIQANNRLTKVKEKLSSIQLISFLSLFYFLHSNVAENNCHINRTKACYFRHGLFQKKIQTGRGLRIYFSENPARIFRFVILPLQIPEKQAFSTENSAKFCDTLEIPSSKTKIHRNLHMNFLWTSLEIPLLF